MPASVAKFPVLLYAARNLRATQAEFRLQQGLAVHTRDRWQNFVAQLFLSLFAPRYCVGKGL
jgi:hypothetical protein